MNPRAMGGEIDEQNVSREEVMLVAESQMRRLRLRA